MKRICFKKLNLTVIVAAIIFFASCTFQNHPDFDLKILETSDVHGSLFPYDFVNNKPMNHSLAQVSSYVKEIKVNPDNEVILLDNGDILQGQPTVYYSNYVDTTHPHICSRIMNYMNYDAGTVGNHDIEAGHKVYDKLRDEFTFPLMAANAVDSLTGKPYFQPYVVLNRRGVKVAVFGMITPGIPNWLPENLWQGITFNDMVETAKYWVPRILKDVKPDVLIGLFHAGHDPDYGGSSDTTYKNENASLLVAEQVPGFDVILIGHDHDEFNRFVPAPDGKKVLVLDPRSGARLVSEATIRLRWNPFIRSYKKEISGRLVPMKEFKPDSVFMALFEPEIKVINNYVSRPVGRFTEPLYSSDALFGDSPFMDLIHRVQLDISGTNISLAAPLSMNVVIDTGMVYIRDMFRLYRFENFLYTMDLTGKEINDYLEYSYDHWMNTMTSDEDHLLKFKTDVSGQPARFEKPPYYRLSFAYYNFDSAEGIDYLVDVSKPDGEKVHIFSLSDGSPFKMEMHYKVAVNSYRGNGGGGHLVKGAGIPKEELASRIITATDKDLRFYMIKWIEKQRIVTQRCNENWKVVPENWQIAAEKRDRSLLFDELKNNGRMER